MEIFVFHFWTSNHTVEILLFKAQYQNLDRDVGRYRWHTKYMGVCTHRYMCLSKYREFKGSQTITMFVSSLHKNTKETTSRPQAQQC